MNLLHRSPFLTIISFLLYVCCIPVNPFFTRRALFFSIYRYPFSGDLSGVRDGFPLLQTFQIIALGHWKGKRMMALWFYCKTGWLARSVYWILIHLITVIYSTLSWTA